jgi:RND family efflux transporter MFP subunit
MGLDVASANASLAAESLSHMQLHAPISGTVLERLAEPGESIAAGVPVIVLEGDNHVEVKLGVTERELLRMTLGQGATLLLDDSDKVVPGTVTSISPSPSPDGLFAVEISPSENNEALRPGTLLTVRLSEQQTGNEIHVPLDAIIHRQDATWVVVLDGGGEMAKTHLRRVNLARAEGRSVLVRAGLSDGERIVREGGQFLEDGQTVRVVE